MKPNKLAFIGGSGIYKLDILNGFSQSELKLPEPPLLPLPSLTSCASCQDAS